MSRSSEQERELERKRANKRISHLPRTLASFANCKSHSYYALLLRKLGTCERLSEETCGLRLAARSFAAPLGARAGGAASWGRERDLKSPRWSDRQNPFLEAERDLWGGAAGSVAPEKASGSTRNEVFEHPCLVCGSSMCLLSTISFLAIQFPNSDLIRILSYKVKRKFLTLGSPRWDKSWPHVFHFQLQVPLIFNIFR